jgi:uncharacterized protein with NAD-binding domain and iron-sulfur cluster
MQSSSSAVSARELFKIYGCSQRLYKEVFEPAIQAALFAPGEQCSAAATLGMLYYYMLSHQVLHFSSFSHFIQTILCKLTLSSYRLFVRFILINFCIARKTLIFCCAVGK